MSLFIISGYCTVSLEFVTQLDTFISRIKHPKSVHKIQTKHSISMNRIQLYRNLTSFRIYQIDYFQLCRSNFENCEFQ